MPKNEKTTSTSSENSESQAEEKLHESFDMPADVYMIVPEGKGIRPDKALVIVEPKRMQEFTKPLYEVPMSQKELLLATSRITAGIMEERIIRQTIPGGRKEEADTFSREEEHTMDVWEDAMRANVSQQVGLILAHDVVKQAMIRQPENYTKYEDLGDPGNPVTEVKIIAQGQEDLKKMYVDPENNDYALVNTANEALAVLEKAQKLRREGWIDSTLEGLAPMRVGLARMVNVMTIQQPGGERRPLTPQEVGLVLQQFDNIMAEEIAEASLQGVDVQQRVSTINPTINRSFENDPTRNIIRTALIEVERERGRIEDTPRGDEVRSVFVRKQFAEDLEQTLNNTVQALLEYNNGQPLPPSAVDPRIARAFQILNGEGNEKTKNAQVAAYLESLRKSGSYRPAGDVPVRADMLYVPEIEDEYIQELTFVHPQLERIPREQPLLEAARVPLTELPVPLLLEPVEAKQLKADMVNVPALEGKSFTAFRDDVLFGFVKQNLPEGSEWMAVMQDKAQATEVMQDLEKFLKHPRIMQTIVILDYLNRSYQGKTVDKPEYAQTDDKMIRRIATLQLGRAFTAMEFGEGHDKEGNPIPNKFGVEDWSTFCVDAPANVPEGYAGDARSRVNEASRALDRAMAVYFLNAPDREGEIKNKEEAVKLMSVAYEELVKSMILADRQEDLGKANSIGQTDQQKPQVVAQRHRFTQDERQ